MPAIAETDDILGRQEGEPLWMDDHGYGYGEKLLALRDYHERNGLLRDWWSLYQCQPRPPEGNLFKTDRMPLLDILPGNVIQEARAWDFASSTRSTGDFTVGLRLAQVQRQG